MTYFSVDGYDSYSGCDIVVTASLPLKTATGETVNFTLGSLQTLSVSTHQDKRPVRSLGNINAKDYVMGQRTIAGSLVFAVFDRHFADKIMVATSVTMADEIPALDLTINFANEYGRTSTMRIYGVKLINEGQVMSINDLYTENTYQFVALGMEPLKANTLNSEQLGNGSNPDPKLVDRGEGTKEITDSKDFQNSKGKIISDKIKNNASYSNKEGVILSSSVEQPITGEYTGIVTLKLTPVQYEGFIYITDLLSNNVIHIVTVNGSSFYNVELPIGYYNAKYMNTTRTKESNIEKIIVKTISTVDKTQSLFFDIYPVIENVTNESISVSVQDKTFSTIICYESGTVEKTLNNDRTIVTFTDLSPDTEYTIYAKSNFGETNTVKVKTLYTSITIYNNFKTFLFVNKNILQNDYDVLINELDSLLEKSLKEYIWPFENIIDGICNLADTLLKQELLLYATMFENTLLSFYNAENPYKLTIIQNNIFDTDISILDWESIKYYSRVDNKQKLEGVITSNSGFISKPGRAYYFYGIDANKNSVKKYMPVFTLDGREFLSNYKNIEKYKLLDIDYYKSFYPSLPTDELYSLAIRDNNFCDRELLEEPYVYINEDNDIVANIDYGDKILSDVYYLCISEIYSTLDPMPKTKIPFNKTSKNILLNDHFVYLEPGCIYHVWIENAQNNIISKTFIFNYKQSQSLSIILDKELNNELNRRKRAIFDIFNKNDKKKNIIQELKRIIEDIVNIMFSDSIPKKDFDTHFEFNVAKLCSQSNNISNILDVLFDVVINNANANLNINRMNLITIDEPNKKLLIQSGSDLDTKIITKSYCVDDDNVVCNVYNVNSDVPIYGDFMSVYLVNEHINKILGVIVFDCSNFDHMESGFVIKEVFK